MSADILRRAADVLRGLATAATPGPWSAADEHGLIPEAAPAWCVSQMRPGFESMSPTEGYVGDVAEVWCDRKDACPDADYIATMHPGVGLALAEWLLIEAHHVASHECAAQCPPDGCDEVHAAVTVARLIMGGDA